MPVTTAALVIALGLVPGYVFLVLTQNVRKPGAGSAVSEILEVLLIGAATTGPALAGLVAAFPGTAKNSVNALRNVSAADSGALQRAVGAVLLLFALALVLAYLLALLAKNYLDSRPSRYSPSVLGTIFKDVPPDHYPLVKIALADGTTVEGVLRAWTDSDDVDDRLIALRRPIRIWKVDAERPSKLNLDRYLAIGSEIKSIGVHHYAKPETQHNL